MLVLTRSIAQSILIGPDVELSVLAVGNGQVRIGISAPRETLVLRKELAQHHCLATDSYAASRTYSYSGR